MASAPGDLDIEGLTPELSLLLLGPPMTGKYELMLVLLARHADSVIMVSTRTDAATIRADIGDEGIPSDRVGVVDCAGRHEADEADDPIVSVNSPANLTGIGVAFTDLFEQFHDNPGAGHVGVGLHSLSQLLMHTNVEQVYQFLQVLAGQVRSAGWFHVAVMDAAEDDQRVLQHHFDGVIETREAPDGGREFRTRGLTPTSSPWQEF